MRKDRPITFPFGSPGTPHQDRRASFLWVRYCIGDDHDPDEVVEVKGHGDFQIDSTLRADIRAIPPQAPDDDDVRETQIHPMGVAEPYLIDVWVQLQGLPANVIGSAIWDGWKTLGRAIHRRGQSRRSGGTPVSLPPEQHLLGTVNLSQPNWPVG